MNQKYRFRFKASMRMVLRLIFTVASFLFLIAIGFFVFYQVANTKKTYATAAGEYRSKATGNWNVISTWETYNGTSWVNASSTPTSTDGLIEIQTGHTVTVTVNVTVDQVAVSTGGTLSIIAGKTLTIANGTGDDLIVNGTMNINGSLAALASSSINDNGTMTLISGGANTFAASATISINNGGLYKAQDISFTSTSGIWTVNSGGTFQYDVNAGNLPLATWNTGSTCQVTGITSTVCLNLTQPFYNFTWNCTSQIGTEKLSGLLTTVNGDFTFISSGTGRLRLSQQESFTLTVGGNFYVQGGLLYVSCKGAADSILITGNYIQTGGTFGLTDGTTEGGVTPTFMTVIDFSISNGTFDMTSNVGNSIGNGVTTLNINGNYSQTGGTFTETATTGVNYGYGKVYFVKSGTQTFSRSAGTMSNTINFTVNAVSILDMSTYYPTGTGSFSVLSGGALIMASLAGITATAASGNVQVTGTRSFSTSANYTYHGAGAQVTGDGLPATVNNLTIDNSYHVTFTNTASVSGIFSLVNGQAITNANEIIVTNAATSSLTGYSSTCYVRGNLRRYVNSSGSYVFPLGSSSYYEYINVNLSTSAGFTNILGTFVNANPVEPSYPLTGITINGTPVDSMLDYGYWALTPNSSMTSGTYTVTLKESGYSNTAYNPACYCVLKRSNSASSWQSLGTHSTTTQSESGGVVTAVRSALISFSHFGIGKHSGVGGLPIELIYFDAKYKNEVVDIAWSTGSEINNDYFTVERSPDGINFEMILTKPGAGNSTSKLYYSDVDPNPLIGYSYYRLKQTDYDGKFAYSEIKRVKSDSKGDGESALHITSVTPNPFNESFTILFVLKTKTLVNFQLINSTGQVVFGNVINTNDGINQYEFIDEKGLPKGIYFIVLICNNEKTVQKILKK